MNNVVFGQYVVGNSYIYKMDPRIKVLSLIILIIATFLMPNVICMLSMLLATLILILSTKVPFIKMMKGLKPLAFLLLFTFFLQIIYGKTGNLIVINNFPLDFDFNFGLYSLILIIGLFIIWILLSKIIKFRFLLLLLAVFLAFYFQYIIKDGIIFTTYNIGFYTDGVLNAIFVFLRIIIVVLLSSLLTFTTSPNDLNNAIESLLSPLKVFKINVGVFAMMVSITIRFVPTLVIETNKVMNAQASRGVDFKESKLKDKVNQIVSLLVPMFVISFKRAEELANAMEARGYVIGEKRTKLDELKIKSMDVVAISLVVILLLSTIVLNVII